MNTPVRESTAIASIARRPAVIPVLHKEYPAVVARRMALIDAYGTIVAVDNEWMTLAKKTGALLHRVGPGANYLEVCRQASSLSDTSRRALIGIQAVLNRETTVFALDYACQMPSGLAFFRMSVAPIAYFNARAAVVHTEITDLQFSKERGSRRHQQFAQRLMNAHEAERQRLSQEMHDDLGNRVALINFAVRRAIRENPEDLASGRNELNKILAAVTDLSTALHEFSHRLYPPSLQYAGIRAALKSVQEEFEKIDRIKVDIAVPSALPWLPDEVQLCLFRVSQEGLQNIAKHSGADRARIVLECGHRYVRLTVSDAGRGFIRSEVARGNGLGLLSMEERALSVGGHVSIKSSPGEGTEIYLTIPIQKRWGTFAAA
jgi:signal transduction histidine kinase